MKIRFTNYREAFPNSMCKWPVFYARRYWSGKIINIGFFHFCISIDRRKNWIKDMITGKPE